MDNTEYYDNPGNGYIDVPTPGTSLIQMPTLTPVVVNHSNNRVARKIERRVELAATQERAKARLTQEVIVNTTALSAIADQAIAAVPSCEAPVRGIVSIYAQSSAMRIAERW